MAQAPDFNCCRFVGEFSRILSFHSCYPQITEEETDTEEYRLYRNRVDTCKPALLGAETSIELSGAFNLLPGNLQGKIHQFYHTNIQQAPNPAAIQRCAHEIFQDISASSIPPVKVASRGISGGPTLLVTYLRDGVETSKVVKWTSSSELDSQRVYQVFLSAIGNQFACPCLVPEAGMIDETSPQYKTYSRETLNLDLQEHGRIRQELDLIRNLGKPNAVKKGDQVFICDKVPGATLFDFIPTQYRTFFPQEKADFYRTLGQIGMLDYVLGNVDRLIHETVLEDNQIGILEANLGNIMIQRNPLRCHLIDNGLIFDRMDTTLLRNRSDIFKKWRETPETAFQNFAAALQQSIVNACNIENIPNFEECRADIEFFKQDVNEYRSSIVMGLQSMDQLLRQNLIPAWRQQRPDFLACQQIISPDLRYELQRRFNAYHPDPHQALFIPKSRLLQRIEEAKKAAASSANSALGDSGKSPQ